MNKDSGFTAFEVAVALAIVAVIAAFATPPYLKWLRSYKLRGATTNLIADLEMAKIRAIRENAFVAVQFAADNYTIFVDNGEGGGTAGDWARNGAERLIRNKDMPAGITIDLANLTFANDRTRFNGRGLPPDVSIAERIPVTNAQDTKQITINRLGFLHVQ
jgi:type IV fimbrial biogenesis protein FimT